MNADGVRVSTEDIRGFVESLAEAAAPKPLPRPNRATRRAIDKKAGRLGKRRRG